jgi:hypothetical protein
VYLERVLCAKVIVQCIEANFAAVGLKGFLIIGGKYFSQ